MKKLVIFGIGEIGKLSYYYFTHDSDYEVVAFTVDKKFIKEKKFCDLPLIEFEKIKKLYPPELHNIFIAIGNISSFLDDKLRVCKGNTLSL